MPEVDFALFSPKAEPPVKDATEQTEEDFLWPKNGDVCVRGRLQEDEP
jgi:hypothetical protein